VTDRSAPKGRRHCRDPPNVFDTGSNLNPGGGGGGTKPSKKPSLLAVLGERLGKLGIAVQPTSPRRCGVE